MEDDIKISELACILNLIDPDIPKQKFINSVYLGIKNGKIKETKIEDPITGVTHKGIPYQEVERLRKAVKSRKEKRERKTAPK